MTARRDGEKLVRRPRPRPKRRLGREHTHEDLDPNGQQTEQSEEVGSGEGESSPEV